MLQGNREPLNRHGERDQARVEGVIRQRYLLYHLNNESLSHVKVRAVSYQETKRY